MRGHRRLGARPISCGPLRFVHLFQSADRHCPANGGGLKSKTLSRCPDAIIRSRPQENNAVAKAIQADNFRDTRNSKSFENAFFLCVPCDLLWLKCLSVLNLKARVPKVVSGARSWKAVASSLIQSEGSPLSSKYRLAPMPGYFPVARPPVCGPFLLFGLKPDGFPAI
jgi:hypothetical protein